MRKIENLRIALAERERLLRQERITSQHVQTLLAAMDVLHSSQVPHDGLLRVLEISRDATGADLALLLSSGTENDAVIRLATGHELCLDHLRITPDQLMRPRRFSDLSETALHGAFSGDENFRSLLLVPVSVDGEPPMAIALFSTETAHFSRFDQNLMQRIATMAKRVITQIRLEHRNVVLNSIVDDGRVPQVPALMADTSFDVLSRAYKRVVDWQGQIIDITNELLGVRSGMTDQAIERTLSRTGRLVGADRTYVFRLRQPDRLDNTHEWVATGIKPMIEHLQDMPADIMGEWRTDFEAGRPVYIPDVDAMPDGTATKDVLQMQGIRSLLAMPMLQGGQLAGFMGCDTVRAARRFLPVEMQLLQSVANAAAAVIDRAAAEAKTEAAIADLRKERNRIEATLAAIPDLIIELDAQGRITSFRAGADVPRLIAPEHAIGCTMQEVLPPPLATLARRIIAEVDQAGRSERYDYELEIEGQKHWFEVSAATVGKHPDARAGYVVAVHDITTTRYQQQQIRKLSRIAQLTSNYVIITDAEGCIEWVNPAFERRSGWHLEEVRGKKPELLLQTEHADTSVVENVRSAIRQGTPVQAQFLNKSRSGAEYWVSNDIQPLHDETSRLEGFVSVQTDITDLKLSHKRAVNALAQAIDASSDGIAISDAEGGYVYMNAAHRRMFGIEETEDIRRLRWQELVPPADAERFVTWELSTLMEAGTWQGQIKGLRRDGAVIDQDVALSLTEEGDLLCIARDITKQRKIEAERLKLREELQLAQRNDTLAQLASEVAHDLSNLVAVVSGTVDLLRGECIGNENIDDGLARIAKAMDVARHLVAGLSEPKSKQDTKREAVDLQENVGLAIELLGHERVEKYVLETNFADVNQQVWANKTELLQVILNLALNACEAEGSPKVKISTGADIVPHSSDKPLIGAIFPDIAYAYFAIADTGKGVDSSLFSSLFKRYMTTKGPAGTGLGLPIVADIVEDSGAALWFHSTLGLGTTVTVAWPMHPPHERQEQIAAAATSSSGNLHGHHILIVDDIPDVAEVLAEYLGADGAVTTVVSSPADAISLLEERPGFYAVLVTDLDMPGINGHALAQFAKWQSPPVPCVLVTAKPGQGRLHDSLFVDVLAKPCDAPELIKVVKKAVYT